MELRHAVCRQCNNRFSREIEQSLARRLAVFRSWWVNPDLERRPFRIPAKIVSGAGLDGRLAAISRDGDLLPPKPYRLEAEQTAEGTVETWRVMDPADLPAVREDFLKRHPDGRWEPGEYHSHTVEAEFDMGTDIVDSVEAHRLAAKIAFSYFAYRLGPELCRSSEFDSIRSFVVGARSMDFQLCDIVADTKLENAVATDIPSHSINLVSDRSTGRVWAVVVLFGVFHFLVTLAKRRPSIGGWWFAHSLSPMTGQSFDLELVKRIGIPTQDQTPSANREEFEARATAAVTRAMSRLRQAMPGQHQGEAD